MRDSDKPKEQLLEELEELHRRVAELEAAANGQQWAERLRESGGRYRSFVEGLREAVYRMSLPDGRYEYASPATKLVFGYSADEFLDNPLFIKQIIHPDSVDDFEEKWADVLTGKVPRKLEYKVIDPLGNERWIVQSNKGIFDDNGNIVALEGICMDITDRKLAEEGLAESEEFSSGLLDNAPYPMMVCSQDTAIKYVNPALEELTGFSSDELLDHKAPYPWWSKEALRKTSRELGKTAPREASRVEELFRNKSGEPFWVEITARPIKWGGELTYSLSTWVDITKRKQAEEAIRQSEEKLRTMFESTSDGIVVTDPKLTIIEVNEAARRLLGEGEEELIGQNALEFMVSEESDKDILKVAEANDDEYKISTEFSVSQLRDSSGGIAGFIGIARDITERKQAEEALAAEKERLAAIIASMTDGLIALDRDGRVVSINPAMERMVSLSAEEVTGQPVSGDEVAPRLSRLAALCRAESSEEVVIDRSPPHVLKVYASRLEDSAGTYVGQVRVVHDVTREKELEQLKDDFIANVSHELRSPLHSIRGFVRLLLGDRVPEAETQREFLTIVEEQSQHLNNLVDDLLDTFALESGRKALKSQQVSMKDVVEDVVLKFNNMATEKGVIMEVELPESGHDVKGDEEALGQVVTNLISNAIKFSPGGGKITVRLDSLQDSLLTQVIDQGSGIPAEAIPQLFDRFYQVDSSVTRSTGGTGLGLYICKQIVEAHGGQIWAESVVGEGSTFSFTIPLSNTDEPQPPQPGQEVHESNETKNSNS